jgi:CheY-like chemotaxis protein
LFAGRKLLIADDSPYYRTVIGLTFTDEGMEVKTAEDGRQALEIIKQSTPDVILASVSMPDVSGYELCRLIKQSERFGHIPVMLLTGLHEHFDAAEARRIGADDVVTKPFKSIRELVDRVGSLLGGKTAGTESTGGHGYSTLGLESSEPSELKPESDQLADADEPGADTKALVSEANEPVVANENNMTDVKVFIEAPLMAEHEEIEPVVEPAGSTCAADVELQTADTQRLEPIDVGLEPTAPIGYAQDDTMEMEPAARELTPAAQVIAPAVQAEQTTFQREESPDAPTEVASEPDASRSGIPEMNEKPDTQSPQPTIAVFNEALLDLGDFAGLNQPAVAEDLVLDLDYEETASTSTIPEGVPESVPAAAPVFEAVSAVEAIAVEPEVAYEPTPTHEELHLAELQEWAIVSEPPPVEAAPVSQAEEQKPTETYQALSPAVIDAIARRAVELLSEKVVREIAWEVVPELAELLIKKKLEEQR